MGKLDANDPRPPYIQVADLLRRAIADGDYKPGDRLPTHTALSEDFGVSVGTIKNALGLLRDRALIVARQGMPAVVRSDLQPDMLSASLTDEVTPDGAKLDVIHNLLLDMNERLKAIEDRLPMEASARRRRN
jgi:DNA-binding GntR family transcriptional regulator